MTMLTMPPIADVVPHSARMLLLDRVVQYDEESLTAELTIRPDSPFVRSGSVGTWVALEYMAQAIAAFAGCEARTRGEPPKVGFLIGSRHFTCTVPELPVGATMQVTVVRELQDDSGLGSFSGTLRGDGISADATLAVFQPHDVQQFLHTSRT
jgi:predicted hotdog family 3-hydroxylacyl-ACP dehydratase